MKKFRGRAILGGAVVAGAIGVGGFAFTAANTVPATKAGDGSGAVTGYVVSTVDYGLNVTNPSNIDSVTFNLDSTPTALSTIKTKLGANWYTCTNLAAVVTCPTVSPQATVALLTALQVVVAD